MGVKRISKVELADMSKIGLINYIYSIYDNLDEVIAKVEKKNEEDIKLLVLAQLRAEQFVPAIALYRKLHDYNPSIREAREQILMWANEIGLDFVMMDKSYVSKDGLVAYECIRK
jgi:hypothetical protein